MKQVTVNFPENVREIDIVTHVDGVPIASRLTIKPDEVVTHRATVDIDKFGRIEIRPIRPNDFLDAMREIQKRYHEDNDGQIAHERAHVLMCEVLRQEGFREGLELLDEIKPY